MPLESSKEGIVMRACPRKSVRANVQREYQSKQGQAGRIIGDGRSMERCGTVGRRSSYDLLILVGPLIEYAPQVVTPPPSLRGPRQ